MARQISQQELSRIGAYYCNNINKKCSLFGKMIDSSLVKLPHAARKVRSTIGSERDSQMDFVIETIPEDGGIMQIDEEYVRYDPEPGNDEMMKAQGFHIIESRIELTDSSGMNRTIVKRTPS